MDFSQFFKRILKSWEFHFFFVIFTYQNYNIKFSFALEKVIFDKLRFLQIVIGENKIDFFFLDGKDFSKSFVKTDHFDFFADVLCENHDYFGQIANFWLHVEDDK